MATSTRSAPDRSAPAPRSPTSPPPLGPPLFLLNLKTYPSCLGDGAIAIASGLVDRARGSGVAVAIAPATPDLARVARASDLPVLAQHTDPGEPGQRTGATPAAAIAAAGARGSIVNHSEHRIDEASVTDVVARLRSAHLASVVCAGTVDEAARLARLRPDFLAIEPPELIGGPISVSSARPALIRDSVDAVRSVSPTTAVLCGAGIRDRGDVSRALELGAVGILVASAVTKAAVPADAIAELLAGYARG